MRHTYNRKLLNNILNLGAVALVFLFAIEMGFWVCNISLSQAQAVEQPSINTTIMSVGGDTPDISPLPTPKPEKVKILEYLVEKFGEDAANAITMIRKCENSTFDQTRTNHNKNGTMDYGVMQINSIHIPKCGEGIKTSWKANIDCGYRIYEAAGKKFTPWTCAHEIGQKNYLSKGGK